MECECCGKDLTRVEVGKELAEKRGWTEGKEYNITSATYSSSEGFSLRKPGLEDLLEEERAKGQTSEIDTQ